MEGHRDLGVRCRGVCSWAFAGADELAQLLVGEVAELSADGEDFAVGQGSVVGPAVFARPEFAAGESDLDVEAFKDQLALSELADEVFKAWVAEELATTGDIEGAVGSHFCVEAIADVLVEVIGARVLSKDVLKLAVDEDGSFCPAWCEAFSGDEGGAGFVVVRHRDQGLHQQKAPREGLYPACKGFWDVMANQRMAGQGLIEWAQTPMGEEVLEGLTGGALAGVPLFFGDNDPKQAALATAAAIAGGIGMGMVGRRLGRHIGEKVHPGALADQDGLPATVGRVLGQETLGEALGEQGKVFRSQIADYLVNEQATKMRMGGASGKDLDQVMGLRKVKGLADVIDNAPPEMRDHLLKALDEDLARLRPLEQELVNGAVETMDEKIKRMVTSADEASASGVDLPVPSSFVEALRGVGEGQAKPVTGGNVGMAIGRVLGDEIGVLGGLGAGMLAGQQLGLQTPKDREIERLKQELAGVAPASGWGL